MIIIESLLQIIHLVISLYIWVVIASALLSWVSPDPHNPIVQVVYRLTTPVYSLIKRYISPSFNGIDLSPIILLLALQILDNIILRVLHG